MSEKRDYRDTVFLPKTDFPMKAGLPAKEPKIAARWEEEGLYRQLREARAGRETFVLHDGPPYANGDMHIGHALNHTLKDMVCRTQNLMGKDPYLTMQFDSEATIVAELMKFAEAGNLYRGSKPVMWSPVEETALAEAEVEYEDITSTQIDVAFEITESPIPELVGAHAVIWTTTPWTIPVNQAIAYGPEVEYSELVVWPAELPLEKMSRQEKLANAAIILVASDLVPAFVERVGVIAVVQRTYKGSDLAGTVARHPMHHLGGFYAKPRPFLPGDFVTTDSGTGLVHMSPDHGEDDFLLCRANGLEPVFAVMADGRYRDDWEWLGAGDLDENGKERRRSVINKPFNSPEGPICSDLREAGALLSASDDYQHSYPHSWRSKAKVIYRCTPQWFVPMDKELGGGGSLRSRAMSEIERVRFIPEKGRRRIGSMVEGRPDWVLSRQRAWGVPITLFVKNGTGEYLQGLVRFGLHACLHPRKRALAGAEMARRPLSGGQRPAPRLVPVQPARKLRHARPRALRPGADARLHHGQRRAQDVQEPRQHDRSAQGHGAVRRGHHPAVGAQRRFDRGPPHR